MAKEFDVNKENELIVKAQRGDLFARREVHKLFNRALNDIVKKYVTLSQPFSAIRMEAEQIFDRALNSYDPGRGYKPMTYLRSYVEQKLMRYVNDHDKQVRVVEKFSPYIDKYKSSMDVLSNELGRDPSNEELLEHMKANNPNLKDLRVKDVQRIKKDIRTTMFSSNAVGRSDEGHAVTMEDLAFTSGVANPMDDYLQDLKAMEIRNKVMMLPEPHRTVILHTYAFNGYKKLSLRDLALKLGINKYRVQEYIKEAEAMLHDTIGPTH